MMKKTIGNIFVATVVLGLLLSACANQTKQEDADQADSKQNTSTVRQLIIAQPPNRLDYEEGDTFDPTGVIINAKLSDGTIVENVPYEGLIVDEPLLRTSLYAKLVYGGKTADVKVNVYLEGNREEYSVKNMQEEPDSPLKGKVIFWLGSSVTEGASSGKESMVDYIAKKHGAQCIKQAVSGTTLADIKSESYVSRLDSYLVSKEKVETVDVFVCQLSTNDRGMPDSFGTVTADDVRGIDAFDKTTTFGAMEYIIAAVKATWNCPVCFYTSPPHGG